MEQQGKKPKTRSLAHTRRQKENDTFLDIARSLPIQENAKDLDKASVLRVAIHYLKLREVVGGTEAFPSDLQEQEAALPISPPPTSVKPSISNLVPNFSKDALQALDGFILVMSREGRILYVSESVTNYLGLRQVDIIGVNAQDIIHQQDFSEFANVLYTQGQDVEQIFDANQPLKRKFIVRMRCAFTPSVRSITRCSNFKPVFCSGYLKFAESGPNKGQFLGIVALCKLASVARVKEMCVGAFFKTKHSLDLSYTNIDTRIRWLLGYDPTEMMGLRAYDYFHHEDLTATSSCHMHLLSQGYSYSPCYRFRSRWGDWLWVRSKSYVIYNRHTSLPEGLTIYTWIVRTDEEDERMLVIKDGKPADHINIYADQPSSTTNTDGSMLDVAGLANTDTSSAPDSPKMLDSADIKVEKPNTPPDSQTIHCDSTSPIEAHCSTIPIPPLSLIMHTSQPAQQTISPPANSALTPPYCDYQTCPPNVNPFSNAIGMEYNSLEDQTTIASNTSSDISQPLHSFMHSPPYTPYQSPTKQSSMDLTHLAGLHQSLEASAFNSSSVASSPYSSCGTLPEVTMHSSAFEDIEQSLTPPEFGTHSYYTSPPSSLLASPASGTPVISASSVDCVDLTSEATQFIGLQNFSMAEFANTGLSASGQQNLTELSEGSLSGARAVPEGYVSQAKARYQNVAGAVYGVCSDRRGNNKAAASETISKWSQWLKESSPPSAQAF